MVIQGTRKEPPGAIIRDGDRKRGVHASPCVVPKNLVRKNCATLHVINPRGYTQIVSEELTAFYDGCWI